MNHFVKIFSIIMLDYANWSTLKASNLKINRTQHFENVIINA